MSVIQELQDAVAGAAETVGPSVVGLGRGWGRGSGVVTASGVVLTNAHVLRGEEVAVAFADGRTEHRSGRRRGRRPRPRGDRRRHRRCAGGRVGSRAPRRGRHRRAGVRARQPRRPRPPRDVRHGLRDRPQLPRPARAAHRRLARAQRSAAARLLRRPAGRCATPPARPELDPDRGRADPRAPRRRGHAAPGGGTGVGVGRGAAAPRDRHRARASRAEDARGGGAARSGKGCSCAESWRTAPRARPACSEAICSSSINGTPLSSVDALFDALESGGELTLGVLRGTEEREVAISLQ